LHQFLLEFLHFGDHFTVEQTKLYLEMLEEIKKMVAMLLNMWQKLKIKTTHLDLMGFGHRVYKNFDPRAKIIKKAADEVLNQLGVEDPILQIAKQLEEAALVDDYFVSRKLYPNVDFYSGIIYRALGIPTEMFTVMFAIGRLPGWIAQWKEMRVNKEPIGTTTSSIYRSLKKNYFLPNTLGKLVICQRREDCIKRWGLASRHYILLN
jgi:citrate synthase